MLNLLAQNALDQGWGKGLSKVEEQVQILGVIEPSGASAVHWSFSC
jgi:hypothetical protein